MYVDSLKTSGFWIKHVAWFKVWNPDSVGVKWKFHIKFLIFSSWLDCLSFALSWSFWLVRILTFFSAFRLFVFSASSSVLKARIFLPNSTTFLATWPWLAPSTFWETSNSRSAFNATFWLVSFSTSDSLSSNALYKRLQKRFNNFKIRFLAAKGPHPPLNLVLTLISEGNFLETWK